MSDPTRRGPIRVVVVEDSMVQRAHLVAVLEADGYIGRVPIHGDKRGWTVRVTHRGRGIVQRLERADADILAGQLRNWSDADLDTLNDLLDRLILDFRVPAPAASRKKAS